MHKWIALLFALALALGLGACGDGGSVGDPPPFCGGIDCPDNAQLCAEQPYPPTAECVGICQEGRCCEHDGSDWVTVQVDCTQPLPDRPDAAPPPPDAAPPPPDAPSPDAPPPDAPPPDAPTDAAQS